MSLLYWVHLFIISSVENSYIFCYASGFNFASTRTIISGICHRVRAKKTGYHCSPNKWKRVIGIYRMSQLLSGNRLCCFAARPAVANHRQQYEHNGTNEWCEECKKKDNMCASFNLFQFIHWEKVAEKIRAETSAFRNLHGAHFFRPP